MSKIIGIVPTAKMFEDDVPQRDLFLFGNLYGKRIFQQGAVPIGILSPDGFALEEALALCDGFLLTGGNKIWPYHLQVVEHAVRHRKPLLGICLGMQAIAAYFQVLERMQAEDSPETMLQCFDRMKAERFMFNHPVDNHYLENVTRETAAYSKHAVTIAEGTRLYQCMGTAQADAVSLHAYRIAVPTADLQVSAVAPDGTIEGVEYGGHIVGVQFHPEAEDGWEALFEALVQGKWTE